MRGYFHDNCRFGTSARGRQRSKATCAGCADSNGNTEKSSNFFVFCKIILFQAIFPREEVIPRFKVPFYASGATKFFRKSRIYCKMKKKRNLHVNVCKNCLTCFPDHSQNGDSATLLCPSPKNTSLVSMKCVLERRQDFLA